MWRWKRILKAVLFWALFCFMLGIIAAFFEIEASTVQLFIIICCAIYLLVTIYYYVIFMLPYRRRVLQQNADMETGNPETALEDIKAMQQEPRVRRNQYLTQCCQINLSAVYCRLEQYDRALEVLNAMPENLKEQMRLVHHMNTCICLFYIGTKENALAYYHTHEKLFHAHREDRNYKGNLAVLKCWALSAQGEFAAAQELLKQMSKLCNTPSLRDAYEKLAQQIENA